ncbi:hypothetical protein N0V94_002154 [Neodidymelliopsis sp. IMI 364377]|nr:hypothetical protein N0V94_002154 [Neodidymelliopsis sp. IMI 364377]
MALPSARDDPLSAGRSSADVSPLLTQASGYEMEEMRSRQPNFQANNLNLPRPSNVRSESVEEVLLAKAHRDPASSQSSHPKPPYWAPVSLDWIYLIALAALSTCLAICCFALVVASRQHHGIATAGTTGEFSFLKRFLPTLVAVLYTLTWTPVAADVIRTEPWALMSRSIGSKAQDSLLKKDKMWWNHVGEAVRGKRRLGGIRWALLISVLASLAASIIINPLSAGLFDTARITTTEDVPYLGADMSASSAQPPRIGDATYLRAAVNLLFNVSTSAWNTDEFSVAPFWPAARRDPPFSASLTSSPSTWIAEQDVASAQVRCEPFTSVVNSTEPYGKTVWTDLPFLQTANGCGFIYPDNTCEGGTWDRISNTTSQATYETCKSQGFEEYFLFCSKNATNTGLMFQNYRPDDKMYFTGQVCSTTFLRARIPVTVSNSISKSTVSVDTSLLANAQQSIDDHIFDVDSFETEFISQAGSTHLRPTLGIGFNLANTDQNSNFKGPALVLAASYNYSIKSLMLADPAKLAKQAGIIKQRFMGEVLLASFTDAVEKKATRSFHGTVSQEQSRLVVDLGVGITMGLVFILLTCAAISLAFLVTPRRRPLRLYTDPNESSTAAFVLNDSTASARFENLDQVTATELTPALKDRTFFLENGKLMQLESEIILAKAVIKDSSAMKPKRTLFGKRKTAASNSTFLDWRPFTLRRKAGFLLVIALICVMAALAAVYAVSKKHPLYQSAFVYSSDINFGKLSVTTLAPYSIIPTLVAVGIKLWWGTIDSAHRRLAPFMAMAGNSKKASKSPTNSYITTPILWVTVLAARRRHWLLALVTFGALISEVLQISMAALWTRELGVLNYNVDLREQYELRSLPHVFSDDRPVFRAATNIAYPKIAQHLYGGELFQTSWVYGSLAELAFGAQPPAWSKDGWSFPPIDLSGISKSIPDLPKLNTAGISKSLNVTMVSQGLRGRIECTIIDNSARWINEITNMTALKPYNTTMNITRPNLRSGYEFSSEVRVVNFTAYNDSQPSAVAIGEWLHFNYSSNDTEGDPLYNSDSSPNFTVLWTNSSYPYLYDDNREDMYSGMFEAPPRLIFAEKPQVQALECQPVFEISKARINVNADNGQIYDLQLLEDMHPATDAWKDRFERHFSNETAYYEDTSQDMNAVKTFNSTVSWGYLFQLALLQACNVQGYVTGSGDQIRSGIPGPTPFSFIETDLYSDPYSYAALALVDYNRVALLQASTLTNVTQRVFSTFFQWFVSSQSGFTDDYWAYQAIATASIEKRAAATSASNIDRKIDAKISIHTETLVISPVALLLSITILVLLVIFTVIIFFVQRKQLSLLPRDFDCPASLLATVYASERLKAWAEQQHKRRPEVAGNTKKWKSSRANASGVDIAANMGYFRGVDGKEHWGIELGEDQPLLMTERFGQDDDGGLQERTSSASEQHQATRIGPPILVEHHESGVHGGLDTSYR